MTIKTIQPDNWAPPRGYANGMLTPDGAMQIGGQAADVTGLTCFIADKWVHADRRKGICGLPARCSANTSRLCR